ncbi:phage replisome organizer N-terminal domain-containing protein [Clostridium sp. YIM B02505]|uniref:Phage replisome organizer N-terminal domain-containing protein n=1 Tax=Clostridium yunnanense TaxID=2800325 RepID=A0ABS1EPN9_9CLOT|nr:phage replisome organizer N-terminal domain-containing protein [Clostridium yunnanense]MBK1811263.1 phage replisome organizer N-terminal domain-containing protein [Clostridium yunnanense]
MRERKYVKFRVDMYEDTKFKIIDMKPERDVIHYIWNRMVLLAGKVNLEGELFLSKNIAYTIETLAIEFNRDIAQVKLALEVFVELEMIELTEDKVYRVKNFAKHQNIKPKKKETPKNEAAVEEQNVVNANKGFSDKVEKNKDDNFGERPKENKEKGGYKTDNHKTADNPKDTEEVKKGQKNAEVLKDTENELIIAGNSEEDKNSKDNLMEYKVNVFESKKRTRSGRKKKNSISNNEAIGEIAEEDGDIVDTSCFTEGVRPLGKGEISVAEFSFG